MGILKVMLLVLYKNRRFQKLIIPILFLFSELGVFIFLSVSLWSNVLQMVADRLQEHTYSKSILVVKFLSPSKFSGHLGGKDHIKNLVNSGFVCVSPEIICHTMSILCAFAGIFIASLWIARYFKLNNLNINWWIWFAGCIVGHSMFYFISIT